MADSDKVRAQRARQHKRGDHSSCVAGRCEGLGGAARTHVTQPVTPAYPQVTSVTDVTESGRDADPVTPPDPASGGFVGRIEEITKAFVATLPYPDTDPRYLLGQLAVELARRIDSDGAIPAAIGQLRILLGQLAEAPNGPAGVVDEARLKHHQRQLDALLAVAG